MPDWAMAQVDAGLERALALGRRMRRAGRRDAEPAPAAAQQATVMVAVEVRT